MQPERYYGQAFFTASSWSEVKRQINKYWDEDYYITDFDYGDGVYLVVMSQVSGWNGQTFLYGSTLPDDEISSKWDEGYYITNMLYDGDWIVVMTQVENCIDQYYFTRSVPSVFNDMIGEGWDDGKSLTKLCCEPGIPSVYCAVMSEFSYPAPAQTRNIKPGRLTASQLGELCEGDQYITELFDLDGAVMVVTTERDDFYTTAIYQSSSLSRVAGAISDYWDDGYTLTTVAFYDGEWFLVFCK
jgi:hypothetical protein